MSLVGAVLDVPPGVLSGDPIGHPYVVLRDGGRDGELLLGFGTKQRTEADKFAPHFRLDPIKTGARRNQLRHPTYIHSGILQRMPRTVAEGWTPMAIADPVQLWNELMVGLGVGSRCVGDQGIRKDSLRGRIVAGTPMKNALAALILTPHDYSTQPSALHTVTPIIFEELRSEGDGLVVRLRGLSQLAAEVGRPGMQAYAVPAYPVTLRPYELGRIGGAVVDSRDLGRVEDLLVQFLR